MPYVNKSKKNVLWESLWVYCVGCVLMWYCDTKTHIKKYGLGRATIYGMEFVKKNYITLSLLFCIGFLQLLQSNHILPSNESLFIIVQNIYLAYPVVWLVIGAVISTLVFASIYLPGPVIILAAVLSSNGSFTDFLYISLVVSLSAVVTAWFSYMIGQYFCINRKKTSLRSWVIGHCSLYTLGFWYYKTKFYNKKQIIYNLLLSLLFLIPYSVLVCYALYPLQNAINDNTNYYIIAGISLYISIQYMLVSQKS